MKGAKLSATVQKAYDFVRRNIDRAVWQAGARLPSTLRLAQEADVNGIAKKTDADPEAWILKRMALEKDILAGVYAHQRVLPSIKELKAR